LPTEDTECPEIQKIKKMCSVFVRVFRGAIDDHVHSGFQVAKIGSRRLMGQANGQPSKWADLA
jgi:DUF438 domain-containing protein